MKTGIESIKTIGKDIFNVDIDDDKAREIFSNLSLSTVLTLKDAYSRNDAAEIAGILDIDVKPHIDGQWDGELHEYTMSTMRSVSQASNRPEPKMHNTVSQSNKMPETPEEPTPEEKKNAEEVETLKDLAGLK